MKDGTPSKTTAYKPHIVGAPLSKAQLMELLLESEKAYQEGRILTHAQVKAKLAKWLK